MTKKILPGIKIDKRYHDLLLTPTEAVKYLPWKHDRTIRNKIADGTLVEYGAYCNGEGNGRRCFIPILSIEKYLNDRVSGKV